MKSIAFFRVCLVILLILAIVLYLGAPSEYSFNYCMYCFLLYACAAVLLLTNNIRFYGTLFIFEVPFSFSFLFVNYVYPVFIYNIDPYFSLFARVFNEGIISKCTALATIGYVSYCIGQIKDTNTTKACQPKKKFLLSPINKLDVIILIILFISFLLPNLTALSGGYSMDTSGGGFIFIFALFYIYKYFAFSKKKSTLFCVVVLFTIIVLYIMVNLLLGNRGEPLYLCVAIIYGYHFFIKKISSYKILIIGTVGLFVFYFVGRTRIASNQIGKHSRSERISNLEPEENILRYGNELIINNRSLFVLVDYADHYGYSYGTTWAMNFFSVVPFGQSFALNILEIPKKKFSTTYLTTYLEFGEDNPDSFGLGTNLIGDIYVSFGAIGVIIFMLLLGRTIRSTYDKSLGERSYSQMLYIIFMILSVYYTRSTLFAPMQMVAWTYGASYINRKR